MTATLAPTLAPPRRRRSVPAPRPQRGERPALRVVSGAERRRSHTRAASSARVAARRRLVVAVSAATVVLSLFGVAAAHVVIAQSQFELSRLERRASEAEARYDRLRLQVAELESPGRIVAAAQERLGMVPPPEVTYLTPTPTRAARSSAPATATASAPGPTEWSLLKPHLATRR